MSMTPRELTSRILEKYKPVGSIQESFEWIESLLTEALKEAQAKGCFQTTEEAFKIIKEAKAAAYDEGHLAGEHAGEEKWFKRGRDAALDEAAKVADDCFLNAYHHHGYADDGGEIITESSLQIAGEEISKKIRALKSGGAGVKA